MLSLEKSEIIENVGIARGIYSMWLKSPQIAQNASAGQFVTFYCDDMAHVLPRPISICDADKKRGDVRFVYRVAGYGTNYLAGLKPGSKISVMGPLGNGFPLGDEQSAGKKALLIGGGIGVAPMLFLAKSLKCETVSVMGYKSHPFLKKEIGECSKLHIATEDGSFGVHGTVMDAISQKGREADIIYACGPEPMLGAVAEFAKNIAVPAWVSIEERMACGIGACLGCVRRINKKDPHSNVNNARVCKDGPVFAAQDIYWTG